MDCEKGRLRRLGLASTAIGAILTGAVFCTALPFAGPARAGDDMLGTVGSWVNNLPLINEKPQTDGGAIDYRPRPALVVPPNSDLPPPQPAASTSPNWPKASDSTALVNARADSRRPAPSADVLPPGDSNDAVFVRDTGPNCNSLMGIPMCFNAPWGQEVKLPGATESKEARGVMVKTQPRKYLIDPPAAYTEPVQLSEADQKATVSTQAAPVVGAAMAGGSNPSEPAPAPGKSKCMFAPGWFGCPYYTEADTAQPAQASQAQASAATQPPTLARPSQQGAAMAGGANPSESEQTQQGKSGCMFPPGWFGCPYN